jgi:uncharacterized protein (TIGR02453 family)
MTRFEGFTPEVTRWFRGLEKDNSRTYFHAHREFFEASIRGPLEALLTELSAKFDGRVRMFRQNRDIRFSADKSPYKTTTAGLLERDGAAALYVSVSATGMVAGGGYHHLARDQLDRYREAVAGTGGPELARRVAKVSRSGLELWGERLATAPRGYPRDHAHVELLRRKGLSLGTSRELGRDGISRAEGLRFVTRTWRSAAPVLDWLDEHVGPSVAPPR